MGDEQETKPKVEAPNVINLVVKDTDGEVHFKAWFQPNPYVAGKVPRKRWSLGV